jgi:HAD superfamily hydrolase (TIGR01509 family)
MTQTALRGVLFDFDGTIADTERFGHRVAYNRAFAEVGLDWHWSESLYGELLAIAGGRERLRHYVATYQPQLKHDVATPALLNEVYRAKVRHFAALSPQIPLRPGVRRLMQELRDACIAVAIATTAAQSGVEAVLRNHALFACVDVIASGDSVEAKKPAPDVYVWALARLQLGAGECVAVEDSNIGLRAAVRAGLATVVTVSDYTAADDFTGARAVVSDLGEPDAPATPLGGIQPAHGIVDVAFLRDVLGKKNP